MEEIGYNEVRAMYREFVNEKLYGHVYQFFEGHKITIETWDKGAILKSLPDFYVFKITPGPKLGLWIYISSGAWQIEQKGSGLLEFMIFATKDHERCVELLAMNAHYHFTDGLGEGHTVPIGEPWIDGSRCDHFLVSLPYTLGPELEICNLENGYIRILWLLPITREERDFKIKHGLNALEMQFEDKGLEYWNPARASVI